MSETDKAKRTLFDSHAHLDGWTDRVTLEAMIGRAARAGVGRILAVGGWLEANAWAMQASGWFPGTIRAAVGLERDQAVRLAGDSGSMAESLASVRRQIERGMADGTVVAIGEIGLDFHYSPETADAQLALLRVQLDLAAELKLPVVIHSRVADEAMRSELRRHRERWGGNPVRIGVLHCFTAGWEFARSVLDLGFHISFSGIVTFPNARALREVAARVPEDRLLIETDTPYLAPVPLRGRPNEPAYLPHVAEVLARERGCPTEHVTEVTAGNGQKLLFA